MWSQQKTDKEGKSNVYTIEHLLPVPHGAHFNNWIARNGNISPAWLKPLTVTFRKADRHDLMAGPAPVINHQWFLSWRGLHQNCQEPGNSGHLGDTQGQELRNSHCNAQVMGFMFACFLLDSLYSAYFSFCWQQSSVPRNHFASLCSTWEHLNTFADGSEPFIF